LIDMSSVRTPGPFTEFRAVVPNRPAAGVEDAAVLKYSPSCARRERLLTGRDFPQDSASRYFRSYDSLRARRCLDPLLCSQAGRCYSGRYRTTATPPRYRSRVLGRVGAGRSHSPFAERMWVTLKSDGARSHLQNQLFGFSALTLSLPIVVADRLSIALPQV
jgi:hypothetical protein